MPPLVGPSVSTSSSPALVIATCCKRLANGFALACEVLNQDERFEIHLVIDLGSNKVQVVIVFLEGGLGVSLHKSQEGIVCEVVLVDLEVMPADDREGVMGNRSLWLERGILVINYPLVAVASLEKGVTAGVLRSSS